MDWIKNMSLKKALFSLTCINFLAAAALSALAFFGCMEVHTAIGPYGKAMYVRSGSAPVQIENPAPSMQAEITVFLLSTLQFLLPILFFVMALLLTASLFYRQKLKKPLEVLTAGAKRIMNHDLDFTLTASSQDELGQLCNAFETMRRSLLLNNQQLWRQAEERKRLNAAFSHDLRNPVTVLKGSAKLARQSVISGQTDPAALLEHLTRIEQYTDRIARYVETMSSVQRLEQLQPQKLSIPFRTLSDELEQSLLFAAQDFQKQLLFSTAGQDSALMLDKSMLFEIAENLTANALRFARKTVSVTLFLQSGCLTLTVEDDGDGFGPEQLKNGIQPFSKGTEESEHFGMGLYLCSLLCEKHGGTLQIKNGTAGAISCATISCIPAAGRDAARTK